MRPGRKSKFLYTIGPNHVCREVFWACLGVSPGNSRVFKYERMVRRGVQQLPLRKQSNNSISGKCAQCIQFFRQYILKHSEKSPALPLLLLDPPCNNDLWDLYEMQFEHCAKVKRRSFFQLWYETLRTKVPCPHTHVEFDVKFRKRRAVGFKTCDECAKNKLKVQMAETKIERLAAEIMQKNHWRAVRADRDELARIRLLCRQNKTSVGFAMDAGDMGKWRTPTTQSTAKVSFDCLFINSTLFIRLLLIY